MAIQLREEMLNFHEGRETLHLLHLSDIHIWFSKNILEKLKTIIAGNKPELIVFTGDYFDTPKGARLFRDFVADIAVMHTIVFIRGNHDFLYGRRIAGLLDDIPNCHCVESGVFRYTSQKGFTYHITSWQQRHLLKKAGTHRNIVLIHNPEHLNEKEMAAIDLVFAGHLHGGQVIFSSGEKGHFPGNLLYKYCTDRKQLDHTTLIVSKGLGDTIPLRFNCAKEVVKLTVT